MTSAELVAARQRLGLTPDQLAAELGIPPHAYRACEAGRAALPRRQAQVVAYRVAAVERDAALTASGLPECAWIAAWDRRAPAADARLEATVRHLEEARAHAAACPTCQAREQFVRERFPDMPAPPVPGWMRAAGVVGDWVRARPAWARPALVGAGTLAVMTFGRALLVLLAAGPNRRTLAMAVLAVPLAALAGAFGGLLYALAGRPLRGLPSVGPYLAGIVGVAGYMTAIVTLMSLLSDRPVMGDSLGASVLSAAFVSVLFGCVVGHQWLREREPAGRGTA
jgi:hypothetical protein